MPKNTEGKEEYERGIPLNELMPVNSSGIVTMGDEFIISDKRETIKERIINLADGKYDNEKLEKYNLGKNYASFILLNSFFAKSFSPDHFQLDVSDRIQQFFFFFFIVIYRRCDRNGVSYGHRTEKRNYRQKQFIPDGGKHYAEGAE